MTTQDSRSHVGFRVKDLDAAIEYYRKMLGAEVELRTAFPATGSELAFVRVGDALIELIEPSDKTGLDAPDAGIFDHYALHVPDLDGLLANLASKGVPHDPAEPRASVLGGRATFVRLSEQPGGSVQLLGD